MKEINWDAHIYALEASGYTRIPALVAGSELQELGAASDRALARVTEVVRERKAQSVAADSGYNTVLEYTFVNDYYFGARCMYCWSDACVRLLENDIVHEFASRVMGGYRLWDLVLMAALPTPADTKATTSWHRDQGGVYQGAKVPSYLWMFLCLDDVTTENGATWVIPGSHHVGRHPEPPMWGVDTAYPTGLQLCGSAGDLLVLNPDLLHNSGHNHSNKSRRLLNIGLCRPELPPLFDHWAIAGSAIRDNASPRLRSMLNADYKPLDRSWPALPEGWPAAK